jgi:hypothetical protein
LPNVIIPGGGGGSRCGNVDLIGFCEDQCGSGDGAVCDNGVPVCACRPQNGTSTIPPQPERQGGRCGNVDLIGFCEDQCGSGDGAVCQNGSPVCAC